MLIDGIVTNSTIFFVRLSTIHSGMELNAEKDFSMKLRLKLPIAPKSTKACGRGLLFLVQWNFVRKMEQT